MINNTIRGVLLFKTCSNLSTKCHFMYSIYCTPHFTKATTIHNVVFMLLIYCHIVQHFAFYIKDLCVQFMYTVHFLLTEHYTSSR